MAKTAKSEKPGIVYIFANPAMKGYIKIGRTARNDVKKRLRELYNSSVPEEFLCLYAAVVADAPKVEEIIHKTFDVDRDNKRREFFKTPPEQIITLLKTAFAISDVTPATKQMLVQISPVAPETPHRERVEKLKKKNWAGIVAGIGTKSPKDSNFTKLRMRLQKFPFIKENVPELRAIVEQASILHSSKRTALLELLDELG